MHVETAAAGRLSRGKRRRGRELWNVTPAMRAAAASTSRRSRPPADGQRGAAGVLPLVARSRNGRRRSASEPARQSLQALRSGPRLEGGVGLRRAHRLPRRRVDGTPLFTLLWSRRDDNGRRRRVARARVARTAQLPCDAPGQRLRRQRARLAPLGTAPWRRRARPERSCLCAGPRLGGAAISARVARARGAFAVRGAPSCDVVPRTRSRARPLRVASHVRSSPPRRS